MKHGDIVKLKENCCKRYDNFPYASELLCVGFVKNIDDEFWKNGEELVVFMVLKSCMLHMVGCFYGTKKENETDFEVIGKKRVFIQKNIRAYTPNRQSAVGKVVYCAKGNRIPYCNIKYKSHIGFLSANSMLGYFTEEYVN